MINAVPIDATTIYYNTYTDELESDAIGYKIQVSFRRHVKGKERAEFIDGKVTVPYRFVKCVCELEYDTCEEMQQIGF